MLGSRDKVGVVFRNCWGSQEKVGGKLVKKKVEGGNRRKNGSA